MTYGVFRPVVVIPESIYEDAIAALERAGAWRATEYKDRIQAALWPDGKLSRTLIARPESAPERRPGDIEPDPLRRPPESFAPDLREGLFVVPKLPVLQKRARGDGSGR